MVNTMMLSNYDSIRYNGKLSPILEVDYDIPSETGNGVQHSHADGSLKGQILQNGSLKFNNYKKGHNNTVSQRNRSTTHNKYSNGGKCSSNRPTEVIKCNASCIKTPGNRIDKDYINECDSPEDSILKSFRHQWDEEIAAKSKESREILSEISKNSTTAGNNPIDKLKQSFNLELDKTIETSDKRTKSKVNKYLKKGYQDNTDSRLIRNSSATVKNSKSKNRSSVIPTLTGKTSKELENGSKGGHNYKLGDPDPLTNTCYSHTQVSPDENKLEVQEIRSSNVISQKRCIPVHKYTGKKFVRELNGINKISREDKTIPFNKGDVQNQRSATKNKYSHNIRANELVTIKGRLSKTDITGTTVVTTIGRYSSGDIEDSTSVLEYYGVEQNEIEKVCVVDTKSISKDLENSESEGIEHHQGRKDRGFENNIKTETNNTETHISPLGCQYKFNDFTCVELTSIDNKSIGTNNKFAIKKDKNESVTSKVKNGLKLEIKHKKDILKTGQECDSQHNPQVHTKVVPSKSITVKNGIMDKTVLSKCDTRPPKKNISLTRCTLKNDKSKRNATEKQVKTTGSTTQITNGSLIPSRLPSNCAKRDSKLQEKVKSALKDDKTIRYDQSISKSPGTNEVCNISKDDVLKIKDTKPGKQQKRSPSTEQRRESRSKTEASKSQNIDRDLSSYSDVNNACQSPLKRKIKGYNKQSEDKETTSEVNETCTDAKHTSIDYNIDNETFAGNKPSKCPTLAFQEDKSIDLHLKNDAEKYHIGCVERSENLTSNDRLHNIGSIGGNNSGEIDHLSDGQNKADKRRVHQTALGELSKLYEFQSEKSISKHDEDASKNNFTFTTDQLHGKRQQNTNENASSANSEKDRETRTGSLKLLNDNGQNVNDHDSASSSSSSKSSILDTAVPETIININMMMGNNDKLITSAKVIPVYKGKNESNDTDHPELSTYDITMDGNIEDYSSQNINNATFTDKFNSSGDQTPHKETLSSDEHEKKSVSDVYEKNTGTKRLETGTHIGENVKPKTSKEKDTKMKPARKLLSPKVSTKKFTPDNTKTTADKCEKDKQNKETVKRFDKTSRATTPKSQMATVKSSKISTASGKQSSIKKPGPVSKSSKPFNEIPSKESSPCSDISNASLIGLESVVRSTGKLNTINKGKAKPICKTSQINAVTPCSSQKETNISDSVVKTQVACCQSAKESNTHLSKTKITGSKYTMSSSQLSGKEKSTSARPSLIAARITCNKNATEKVTTSSITEKNKNEVQKPTCAKRTALPVKNDTNLASTRKKLVNHSSTGTKTKLKQTGSSKPSSPLSCASSPCISRSNSITSVSSDRHTTNSPSNIRNKAGNTCNRSKVKVMPTSQLNKHGTTSGSVLNPQNSCRPKKPDTLKLRRSIDSKSSTPSPTLSRSSRASSIASPTTSRSSISSGTNTKTKSNISNIQASSTSNKVQRTANKQTSQLQKSLNKNTPNGATPKMSKLPVTRKPLSTKGKAESKLSSVKNNESRVQVKSDKNLQKIQSNQHDKVDKGHPGKDFIDEKHLICNKTDINVEILKTVCVSDKTDQVSTKDQIKAEVFDFCEEQNTTNTTSNKQVREQVQDPLIQIVSKSNGKTIAPMDEIQQEMDVQSSSGSVSSDPYWSASDGDEDFIEKNFKHNQTLNTEVSREDLLNMDTKDSNETETSSDVDDINYTISTPSINSHVHSQADDCSLQAFESASNEDLLHNHIDRTYKTEIKSENSTRDRVDENISQQQSLKHGMSEELLINSCLLRDSEKIDKAQYVSKDYEQNIINHSNLEQDFNVRPDINEVNQKEGSLEYSSDREEEIPVKVSDVKTERLSTTNIMEYQINQKTVSSEYQGVALKSLNKQTEKDELDLRFTAVVEYSGRESESCEVLTTENSQTTAKINKASSTVRKGILLTSTVLHVNVGSDLHISDEHSTSEILETNEIENVPVAVRVECENHLHQTSDKEKHTRKIEISNTKQVELIKREHENTETILKENLSDGLNNNCALVTNKGDTHEYVRTDILEVRNLSIPGNSQFRATTIHQNEEVSRGQNIIILEKNDTCTYLDHNTILDIKSQHGSDGETHCQQFEGRGSSSESSKRTKKYSFEYTNDALQTDDSARSSDVESDASDNSMASSVQNSPNTRRPRRVFSKEERKLKYEKLMKKSQPETSLRSSAKHIHQSSSETVAEKGKDYQTSFSQKIETNFSSSDNESKNISAACDSADFNSTNRCRENSLINIGTDRLEHITDERNHKHGKQNLNEKATFTKIITNERDIKLSNSQSYELELTLSEESGLSSAKCSVDSAEDASQDVVKRNRHCVGSENRRAVNLEKVFHSEDGFSISVECTLNLDGDKSVDSTINKAPLDVEETFSICLNDDIPEKEEHGLFIPEKQQNVSTVDKTLLNMSLTEIANNTVDNQASGTCVKDSTTHCDQTYSSSKTKNVCTPTVSVVDAETTHRVPEVVTNTITIADNKNHQTPFTLNSGGLQLDNNLKLNTSNVLHSADTEQLRHDQNIFKPEVAVLAEKEVTCTAYNAMPCVETDKSSVRSYDETSEMYGENNKSPADRKHLMLDLSAKEEHNTTMHLTDNVKFAQKNKGRQHPRRLTDIIRYGEDENDAVKPDLKPRAKSKSPARCLISLESEKDQKAHAGYGKVSEICRTFIQKTHQIQNRPISPADTGKPIHVQSSASSKQMKWARVEGVWQRIPVDDDVSCVSEIRRVPGKTTAKPNRRSAESLSQWKNLVDKIQKIQKEKRDLEESASPSEEQDKSPCSTTEETNKASNETTVVTDVTMTTHKSKPPPPKTLPKPKRYNRSQVNAVNDTSIPCPTVNYQTSNISTRADNEHCKHLDEESNKQDFDENKTKQMQESVHNDKRDEVPVDNNCKVSENKQESAINTKTESEGEKAHFQKLELDAPLKVEGRVDMDSSDKNIDTKEPEEGQNETNKKDLFGTVELEYKELTKSCDGSKNETRKEQNPSEQKPKTSSCVESKLPRYTPAKIRMMRKHEMSLTKEKTHDNVKRNERHQQNDTSDVPSKLVTMPIKQEVFPKEEDISSDIIAKVLKVMDSFSNEKEDITCEKSGVKFVIGSEDSSETDINIHIDSHDQRSTRPSQSVPQHGHGRTDPGPLLFPHRQHQLLSEISELEERNNDDILEDSNKNITHKKTVKTPLSNSPSAAGTRSPSLQRSSFSRSHSLPTTALSHPGSRILYRDGSFVIEPDFPEEMEEDEETRSLDIENGNIGNCNSLERDVNRNKNNYSMCRRSQSEADLCDVDSEDNLFLENEADLTVIENGNVGEGIKNASTFDQESPSVHSPQGVNEQECNSNTLDNIRTRRIKKKKLSARRSRSFRDFSDTEKPIVKLKRNLSFVEAVNDRERLKSSDSVQSIASTISLDESLQCDRKMSLDDTRTKSPGFLQKVFSRRKGSVDQGGKKKSESKESILKKMSLKTIFGAKKGKELFEKGHIDEPQTPPIAAFQSDNDIHIIDSTPGSPYSSLRFKRRHTSAEIYDQCDSSSARSSYDILTNHRARISRHDDQLGMRSLNSSSLSIAEQPLRPKSPKPNVTIVRRNSNLSLPSSPTGEVIFDMGGKPIDRKHDSADAARLIGGCNHNNNNVQNQRPHKQFSGADLEKLASKLVQNDMTSSNSNDSGIQHDVSVHSSNESLKVSPDGSVIPRRRKSPSPRPERPKSEISVRWADLVEHADISPVKRRDGTECRPRPKSDLEENLQLFDEMYEELFDDYMYFTGGSSLSPDMKPFGSQGSLQLMYSSLQSLDSLRKHDPCEQKASKRRKSMKDFPTLINSTLITSTTMDNRVVLDENKNIALRKSKNLTELVEDEFMEPVLLRTNLKNKENRYRLMSTPHPIKTRLSTRVPPPKQPKRSSLVRSHSMPESLDKLHRRRKLHSVIASSNLHDIYLRNFDDDSSSDDGSDISVDQISLTEKSLSARTSRAQLSTLDEMPESENRTYAEALWDHITMDPEELRFRAGDLIEVIDMNDKDWWYGALDDHQEGWLPATFVRLRVNQEHFDEDLISRFSEIPDESSSPNLRRISMINPDQGRTNVIKEILQAEQDYVKHMKDVVEGYIRHARKRVDMFSEEKISVIFGNIEEIFKFSTQFLDTLESAYCKDQPHQSELGKCFLKHSKGFEIYSDYCNNHPSGSAELKDLYRKQKYRHFFEACRLLQEMIEIPLEGFLLNPVQKICKYPLQLAELLKYTPPSHPDYHSVQQALEAMKKIAALINERKRKMESIEKLARWQHTVEDWQGRDLLEKSSELIYSSEINKINSAGWSQERWFYLFDHQLVYCKKDLLKRNGFSYKGRIDLDQCEIINLEDGKDVQYNVTVKNAWKIHETHKDKWYLLYAKTPAEKQRWLKAFQKEREKVIEDQENNFIPDHWKRTILNRIKAAQEKQNSRTVSEIQYKQEFIRGIPSHATLPRSYSKKQTKKKGWFPFGGKQKTKT